MSTELREGAQSTNDTGYGLLHRVTPSAATVWSVLAVCAGYYVAGLLSLVARFPESGISTIWLATPVLLAAFLVAPPRTWWLYCAALLPTIFISSRRSRRRRRR
jgi:hypothetical protein